MRDLRWLVVALVGCPGVDLTDGVPTNPNFNCLDAQEFAVGLSATSPLGRVVSIRTATPAPPDVGDNAWVLTVVDEAGAPMGGLTPAVTPWMPLHAHGLVPADYFGAEVEPGAYEIEPFDLIMPGLWEFTVDLGAGDGVVFKFCAEG